MIVQYERFKKIKRIAPQQILGSTRNLDLTDVNHGTNMWVCALCIGVTLTFRKATLWQSNYTNQRCRLSTWLDTLLLSTMSPIRRKGERVLY